MLNNHDPIFATLNPRIHALAGDRPFPELLKLQGPCSEEALAAIIETDGRARLERGLGASLETYLQAIPALEQMTVALDSAIDMALRSLAGNSAPTEQTVELLVLQFPNLEPAIREAAMLGHALHTAAAPKRAVSRYAGKLPCDFGPLLPDVRPQYVLQKLLGRGAFGEVYLAHDRLLSDDDRPALVAIKVLADDPENAGLRYRLADEATKARRVDHPNVVRVIARATEASTEDFVVYEYVEGPNLQEFVRRRPARLTNREAVMLAARIARGVQAAHAAGLVHRDLKPGNVLIDAAGNPRITDFGVAMRDQSGSSPESGVDDKAGTLAFMAPEQFSSRLGAVGPPADIFAIAGILIWLLVGRPPFGATPEELTNSHIQASKGETPDSLKMAAVELDPTLRHILLRALRTAPEQRYGSAAELAEELTCWLEKRPVPSMNLGPRRRFALWTRRRPGLAGTAALALISIITGAAIAAHLRALGEEDRRRLAIEDRRKVMLDEVADDYRRLLENMLQTNPPRGIAEMYLLDDAWKKAEVERPGIVLFTNATRTRGLRDRLHESRLPSGEPSFETAFWLAIAAVWSVTDGPGSGYQDIDEAKRFFEQRFPGDPWIRGLDALRNGVDAQAVLHASAFDHNAALEVAIRLEKDIAELDRRALFSISDIARDLLRQLNAPERLNRPTPAPSRNTTAGAPPAKSPAP